MISVLHTDGPRFDPGRNHFVPILDPVRFFTPQQDRKLSHRSSKPARMNRRLNHKIRQEICLIRKIVAAVTVLLLTLLASPHHDQPHRFPPSTLTDLRRNA